MCLWKHLGVIQLMRDPEQFARNLLSAGKLRSGLMEKPKSHKRRREIDRPLEPLCNFAGSAEVCERNETRWKIGLPGAREHR
jgi:hypothetical protein